MKVGVAAYEEGPTGCTVFYFPTDPTSVIDARGGHKKDKEIWKVRAIDFDLKSELIKEIKTPQ